MIRVAHVITGLGLGGMEGLLVKLLSRLDRARFSARVMSLGGEGPLAASLKDMDVPVDYLDLGGAVSLPVGFWRLWRWIKSEPADIVHTWMYHADFLGGLAARAAGNPVVWGVAQSNLSPSVNRPVTLRLARINARLSRRIPAKIVCVGGAVARAHAAIGYDESKLVAIPNGFDTAAFRPDPEAAPGLRREFRLPENARVLGLAGRYDPQKDHATFLAAFARAAERRPELYALVWGEGTGRENQALTAAAARNGLENRIFFLGRRRDVARLTAGLDLLVSASRGEGFASVIGEAMSCEVPCVVTDVGDSALIVGETGRAVPAGDPAALAEGILSMLALTPEERRVRGAAARRRIEENFSLVKMTELYARLYAEAAA